MAIEFLITVLGYNGSTKKQNLKFKFGNCVIQNFDKSFHQNVPIMFHYVYTFFSLCRNQLPSWFAKQISYMNWNNTQKNESEFYWGRVSYKSTKIYIKASKQEVQYSFTLIFWSLFLYLYIHAQKLQMLRNCIFQVAVTFSNIY